MGYHVRRIDPFWKASPVVLTVAVIGALAAMFGYTRWVVDYSRAYLVIMGIGALMMAAGVLLATKPAVSAILGCLGFLGGLITFVLMPNVNTVDMSMGMRMVSALMFTVLYMVLMDALILVVAALYNFFAGSLGGLLLEIEPTGQAETEGE
ncbi:MAG TPA: hypothetical protein DCM05_08345 [Elusimicrobia bacterium]|nr:hypothetical protein [Elusimicrobiota bacterium]